MAKLKDKAADMAAASADALKDQASDLIDAAGNVASESADKLKDAVADKKSAGAEYVGSLAEALRRAAREFDEELPFAGSYIRKAAAQVDGVSESIRTGEISDVVRSAQTFARRQPAIFLGLAAITGFAVVRFLKSSSEGTVSNTTRSRDVRYRDDFSK